MSALDLFDMAVSVALVAVCWWLSHQNATGREPFGKTISTGYALLAMSTLGSLLFGHVDDLAAALPASLVFGKTVLTFTLGVVAVRLAFVYGPDPDRG